MAVGAVAVAPLAAAQGAFGGNGNGRGELNLVVAGAPAGGAAKGSTMSG